MATNLIQSSTSLASPVAEQLRPTSLYRYEANRLETFQLWPHNWLDRKLLAMVGFFYVGSSDIVECYFCKVNIGTWERDDQPLSEHFRWSPNCPLLNRHNTDNVPIDVEELDRILPQISYDFCERHGFEATCSYDKSAAMKYIQHQYPEYATFKDRLDTFKSWPFISKPKPAQLAKAGFFYLGRDDCVKCFSCGGEIRDFENVDDPWVQHALSMGDCRFLQLSKGIRFVMNVKNKDVSNVIETPTKVTNDGDSGMESACSEDMQKACKICYENQPNTVFLPCGHIAACNFCAANITKCPICRSDLTDVKRIFFA